MHRLRSKLHDLLGRIGAVATASAWSRNGSRSSCWSRSASHLSKLFRERRCWHGIAHVALGSRIELPAASGRGDRPPHRIKIDRLCRGIADAGAVAECCRPPMLGAIDWSRGHCIMPAFVISLEDLRFDLSPQSASAASHRISRPIPDILREEGTTQKPSSVAACL